MQHPTAVGIDTYRFVDQPSYLMKLAEKSAAVRPNRFIADGDTVVVLSETTAGGETGQDVEVFMVRTARRRG